MQARSDCIFEWIFPARLIVAVINAVPLTDAFPVLAALFTSSAFQTFAAFYPTIEEVIQTVGFASVFSGPAVEKIAPFTVLQRSIERLFGPVWIHLEPVGFLQHGFLDRFEQGFVIPSYPL
jgi:hypothetical protein